MCCFFDIESELIWIWAPFYKLWITSNNFKDNFCERIIIKKKNSPICIPFCCELSNFMWRNGWNSWKKWRNILLKPLSWTWYLFSTCIYFSFLAVYISRRNDRAGEKERRRWEKRRKGEKRREKKREKKNRERERERERDRETERQRDRVYMCIYKYFSKWNPPRSRIWQK